MPWHSHRLVTGLPCVGPLCSGSVPQNTQSCQQARVFLECLTDTPGAGVLFPFSSKDISPAEALDGVLSHLPPAGRPPSPPNGGFTICGNLPKTLESRDSNYSDTISIRTVPGS